MAIDCVSIKQALAEHLLSHVAVQHVRDMCVATVPFATVDDRWVDVFIEPRAADFLLIHDGGKALNELILHGMKITPSVEREFVLIAERFGISYTDEMFQTGAKMDRMAQSVSAVGMSSALATAQLLGHVPAAVEDALGGQLHGILKRWSVKRARVTENMKVSGELKQHTFDFVLTPTKASAGQPIAVSILNPTAGALSAAERFGFKTKDLEGTDYGRWKRIAVEAKAEVWSQEARRLVARCASAVVSINSGQQPTYEQISQAIEAAA